MLNLKSKCESGLGVGCLPEKVLPTVDEAISAETLVGEACVALGTSETPHVVERVLHFEHKLVVHDLAAFAALG